MPDQPKNKFVAPNSVLKGATPLVINQTQYLEVGNSLFLVHVLDGGGNWQIRADKVFPKSFISHFFIEGADIKIYFRDSTIAAETLTPFKDLHTDTYFAVLNAFDK